MRDDDAAPLTIRRLRCGDGDAVAAITERRFAGVGAGDPPPPPDEASRPMTPGDAAALVASDCSWVAERDGRPVGVLLAQPIAFVDGSPLTFWVEEIAVVPDQRRRGVATALYRAFGTWARAAGAQGVLTRVDPDDAPALALHRRVGFEPHGTDALLWRL